MYKKAFIRSLNNLGILFAFITLFIILPSSFDAQTFFINESFEGGELPFGWSIKTISGNPWKIIQSVHNACDGEHTLMCSGNKEELSDAWCYSKEMRFENNTQYLLSMNIKARFSFSAESLSIILEGSDNYSQIFYDNPSFDDISCQKIEKRFTVPEDGDYRLAFHYSSEAGSKGIFIDNIRIKKDLPFRIEPKAVSLDTTWEYFSLELINNTQQPIHLFFSNLNKNNILSLPEEGISIEPYKDKNIKISCNNHRINQWMIKDILRIQSSDKKVFKQIELFLHANSWTDITDSSPLPFSDFAIGAATDNKHIYAFSGFASSNAARFDLLDQKWQMLKPPPEDTPEPYSAVYYKGSFYFMSSGSNTMYRYTYNDSGGSYYAISGPEAFGQDEYFRRPCLAEFGGIIYIMGHINSPGPYNIQFWKYKIATENWTKLPLPETPRMLAGMTSRNGKIYIMGGRDSNYRDINNGEVYDIIDKSWHRAPFPPIPEDSGYPAVLLRMGAYIFFDRGRMANQMFVYKLEDPSWDSWIELQPKPSFNFYAGSIVADGKLHMIGGTRDVPLSDRSVRNIHYIMTHDKLIADAGKGGMQEAGDKIQLGAHTVASGGTPPYHYKWSDGLGWQSEKKNPAYVFHGNTKLKIKLIVSDSAGNMESDYAVYYPLTP